MLRASFTVNFLFELSKGFTRKFLRSASEEKKLYKSEPLTFPFLMEFSFDIKQKKVLTSSF